MLDIFMRLKPGDVLTADDVNAVRRILALASHLIGSGTIQGVVNSSFQALASPIPEFRLYGRCTADPTPLQETGGALPKHPWEEVFANGSVWSAVVHGFSETISGNVAYDANGWGTVNQRIIVIEDQIYNASTGKIEYLFFNGPPPATYTREGIASNVSGQFFGAGTKVFASLYSGSSMYVSLVGGIYNFIMRQIGTTNCDVEIDGNVETTDVVTVDTFLSDVRTIYVERGRIIEIPSSPGDWFENGITNLPVLPDYFYRVTVSGPLTGGGDGPAATIGLDQMACTDAMAAGSM